MDVTPCAVDSFPRAGRRLAMLARIVFVFDIASSTILIEDLQQTGRTVRYDQLIGPISEFLDRNSVSYKYEVYKFLGDGFILIFDEGQTIDNVLIYSIALTTKFAEYMLSFKRQFIQTRKIERLGLTIGIDKGEIFGLTLRGIKEFRASGFRVDGIS